MFRKNCDAGMQIETNKQLCFELCVEINLGMFGEAVVGPVAAAAVLQGTTQNEVDVQVQFGFTGKGNF